MELVLDETFNETYELYYGELRHEKVLGLINKTFEQFDYELINETVNIIKTSITLGFTYTRCHEKIVEKILDHFPIEKDIDLFILNVILKILIATEAKGVEKLFTPRNVVKEVAAKYFRVPQRKVTDEMIERIMLASDKFKREDDISVLKKSKNWDDYFYGLCKQVASNSRCFLSRKGAILVRNKISICTGYNGPARGLPKCDSRWLLDNDFNVLHKDLLTHETNDLCPSAAMGGGRAGDTICIGSEAEVNVIASAGMEGIKIAGSTLYTTGGIPSCWVLNLIINSGVSELVVTSLEASDSNAIYVLNQSKLGIRLFDFVK